MAVVPVMEWLDEVLGLPAPGTGEVRGSRLAYSAILGVLVGEEALRASGVQVDGALLESSDVFRHVYEVTMGRLAQSVLEGYLAGLEVFCSGRPRLPPSPAGRYLV